MWKKLLVLVGLVGAAVYVAKKVRTANVTQSAIGDKRGLWTTVLAAAVMIFE